MNDKKWTKKDLEELTKGFVQHPIVSYDGSYELRLDIKYWEYTRVIYLPYYLNEWDGKLPLRVWLR